MLIARARCLASAFETGVETEVAGRRVAAVTLAFLRRVGDGWSKSISALSLR